jgi:hypothetical protein
MSPSGLSPGTAPPMDVSVHWKPGQRWLQKAGRPSLLGDGLLERTRATSLALLGAATAVGLAIVALAFNQGWPLIAGSGIPRLSPRHRGVGEAIVASRGAAAHSTPAGARTQPHPSRRRSGRVSAPHAGTGGTGAAAAPTNESPDLVVSPSAPAQPRGGKPHGAPAPHGSAPASKHPAQQAPAQTPSRSPTAAEPASPAREPTAAPPPAPPEATVSEAPAEESNVPSWSEGKGHAYGRGEEWHDHGGSGGEGEGGWGGGHGYESHDHGDWGGHG